MLTIWYGKQRRHPHGLLKALQPAIGVLLLDGRPRSLPLADFPGAQPSSWTIPSAARWGQGQGRTGRFNDSPGFWPRSGSVSAGPTLWQLAAREVVQITGVLAPAVPSSPGSSGGGSRCGFPEARPHLFSGRSTVKKSTIAFEIVAVAAGGLHRTRWVWAAWSRAILTNLLSQLIISQFTVAKFVLRPGWALRATLSALRALTVGADPDSIMEILDQGIEIDILDALDRVVGPVASAAFGLAHPNPVGPLVARTLVGRGLHETFQQPRTQTIAALEILAHLLAHSERACEAKLAQRTIGRIRNRFMLSPAPDVGGVGRGSIQSNHPAPPSTKRRCQNLSRPASRGEPSK